MNKEKLIASAREDCIPSGTKITGYCTVDEMCIVTCTRDKLYQELGGRLDDCVHAAHTTKAKCKYWKRVKSFTL